MNFNGLLVISNLSLLPLIIILIYREDFVDAFFFITLMVASICYHLCLDMGICFFQINILRFVDVLFATSVVIYLILFYVDCLQCLRNKPSLKRQTKTIIMLGIFLMNGLFLGSNQGSSTIVQKLFIALYFFSIFFIISIIELKEKKIFFKKWYKVNYYLLTLSIFIGILGYTVFEISGYYGRNYFYWITHSIWHFMSAIALFLITFSIKYYH